MLADGTTSGETTDVVLVVVAVLVALVVGRLTGGRLTRLGGLPLRRTGLVLAAAGAQLVGAVVGGPAHPVGLLLSAALVVSFLAANRGLRGTGLLAFGLLANALVVGANGAMPVSADAAARAGVAASELAAGQDPRHELSGPATRLRWLGDVVPVPLPGLPQVVSPGDVLVAAGAAQLVVAGMLRPLPPRPGSGPGRQPAALSPARPPFLRSARARAGAPGESARRAGS